FRANHGDKRDYAGAGDHCGIRGRGRIGEVVPTDGGAAGAIRLRQRLRKRGCFVTAGTPTPLKEQKSAEVIEKKDGPKWEVQKSEKRSGQSVVGSFGTRIGES